VCPIKGLSAVIERADMESPGEDTPREETLTVMASEQKEILLETNS
jgi:hypothetical protein